MPLVRGHHTFDNHFTQIPNDWVRDSRLSFKARGLLVLLMSHSPGWNMSVRSIAKANGTGIDTIKSAVKELEQFGYLARSESQNHAADGTFADYIWTTCDPFQNPVTVKTRHGEMEHKEEQVFKEEQVNKEYLIINKPAVDNRKGTRFSEDAILTEEMRQFVLAETPHLNAEKVFAEFKDYWISVPGSRGVKLDWLATWRNWCRKQKNPRGYVNFKEQAKADAREKFLNAVPVTGLREIEWDN